MQSGSTERFGFQWARYDSVEPIHEEQFRRWLPFVRPEDWRGLRFLDVGCGMGRNSYWPMTYGATAGKAIDLDQRTLASARRTLAPYPSLEVVQQSAYDAPEQDRERFDVAFSIGVIHHLEHPERALGAMAQAVRPGGRVCIWVYGREGNAWLLKTFDPLRRHLLSKVPIAALHAMSLPSTMSLWLALRVGLGRSDYFDLLRRCSLRHLRYIVLDHMLPREARYYRQHEVEALLRNAGLHQIEVRSVNGVSWAGQGLKPAR